MRGSGGVGCYHLVFEDRWLPWALEWDGGLPPASAGFGCDKTVCASCSHWHFSKKHFSGLGCC